MLRAGLQGAPPSPYNVEIGPHRRFAWADGDLAQFKAIKTRLGGTVNDVVLTVVTGALRTHMQANDHEIDGVELKAMVPVSVRAEAERGALGNRVTSMFAPLPVYADDPVERFEIVHEAMKGLKESGQAVGAELLTELADFAPPTVLAQASRLQSSQRAFNVVVTNVPGPQFPLYMLGRKLLRIYPQVPLVRNTALGIAIMSYDGTLNFGLLGDYDALPDLDDLAAALRDAIAELAAAAGVARAADRARAVRRFLGGLLILALSLAIVIAVVHRAAVARRGQRRQGRGAGREGRRALPGHAGGRDPRRAAAEREPDPPGALARQRRAPLPGPQPPATLRELQDELTGPFDAEIAAAGQAVILARGGKSVEALAWGHRLRARTPERPAAAAVRRSVARRGRAEALLASSCAPSRGC